MFWKTKVTFLLSTFSNVCCLIQNLEKLAIVNLKECSAREWREIFLTYEKVWKKKMYEKWKKIIVMLLCDFVENKQKLKLSVNNLSSICIIFLILRLFISLCGFCNNPGGSFTDIVIERYRYQRQERYDDVLGWWQSIAFVSSWASLSLHLERNIFDIRVPITKWCRKEK